MSAHSGLPTEAEAKRRSIAVVDDPYTTGVPFSVSCASVNPASTSALCVTRVPARLIGDEPPASRFREAPRRFPEALPPIVYDPDCLVRRVQDDGRISFMNRNLFVSNAFAGQPIGLRPTARDGVFDIMFCSFTVRRLDLSDPSQIES